MNWGSEGGVAEVDRESLSANSSADLKKAWEASCDVDVFILEYCHLKDLIAELRREVEKGAVLPSAGGRGDEFLGGCRPLVVRHVCCDYLICVVGATAIVGHVAR